MKKRSEMTPSECVDYILKGASLDDAETSGIEIIARCLALHVYAMNEGEEYFDKIMRRICQRAYEWTHLLAMAAVAYEHKLRDEEEGCTN